MHVTTPMTREVTVVPPELGLDVAYRIMQRKRIRHLPVVDQGALIGMISIGDCVKSIIDEQRAEIEDLKRYIAG